eukprot:g23083.t1
MIHIHSYGVAPGHEYDNVWRTLLQDKQLPYTPAPDLDQMWGYYKYGGMDEQALLDQACEVLGKFPCRASAALLWRPRCTRRCGVTSIQEQVEMCQFS